MITEPSWLSIIERSPLIGVCRMKEWARTGVLFAAVFLVARITSDTFISGWIAGGLAVVIDYFFDAARVEK